MIRLLVLDVDGTMTDGGVYYDSTGNELKKFAIKDGAGIALARAAGIRVMICTGRACAAVERRAADLHIEDPRHSVAQIRVLKNRLNACWDALYTANRFPDSPTLEEIDARAAAKAAAKPANAAEAKPAEQPKPVQPDHAEHTASISLPKMELPGVGSADPEGGI